MAENYILFSLDDEKSKKLGEIISNSTARKIVNFLAENEASESDIASKLDIPMNTVNYNVKKLVQAGLIEEIKHWWSIRGKRIPIYRVSNKKIVISPKKSRVQKLKNVLPVVIVAGIFSLFLKMYNSSKEVVGKKVESFAQEGMMRAATSSDMAQNVGDVATNSMEVSGYFFGLDILTWFLLLMWFVIVGFVVYSWVRK